MAVFQETWKNAQANIRERGIFMFNSDLLSDVSLVVRSSSDDSDAKKSKMAIPAHKIVLSICSPVFFAMFNGELSEKSDSIDLPDCEYEGVLEMLRYMYSGEVKFNESNVMQVLYVAKKYILPSLAEECVDFLIRNLDVANVFCLLSYAEQYDEKCLVDRCWELIDRETGEAVKSEGFATIQRSLLEVVVKRDSLDIREVELFKAVDLWATKECERQGLAVDGQMKRKILGEQIVKGIRFPAMEEKEFASVVLDSDILTKEEMACLVKNFNGVLTRPVCFPEDRRIGPVYACSRFEDLMSAGEEGGWNYDRSELSEYIEFSVDKDIMLHGIRLFGSKGNNYKVFLEIMDCQTDYYSLIDVEENFLSVPFPYKEEEIYVIDILFAPCLLKRNNRYVAETFLTGQNSCYGISGSGSVQCHGVTFHFRNSKLEKPCDATAVECGQFAEFLFKPVG